MACALIYIVPSVCHLVTSVLLTLAYTCRHSLHKKDLEGSEDVRLAGVQAQLQTLGQDHVGYTSKRFPKAAVSVVGARPFSAVCHQEQFCCKL